MTYEEQKKEMDFKGEVRNNIYLNSKFRWKLPANHFPEEIVNYLTKLFFDMWKKNVLKRTDKVILGDKEKKVLRYCFDWCVCSPDFKGDLKKGLFIASKQGFGKDALLRTIVDFYDYFLYNIKYYPYTDFAIKWFDNSPEMFNSPVYISDIYDNGKLKREKESIPFLEFLDYREQVDNRRGILVSSNYTPEALQELLEHDKQEKRLHERMKECFNIVLIKDADSKRKEEIEII